VYNNIGLEPDWTYRVKLCIGNLGKWNSVKWNETRRIGAIFASFWVARGCQRQLGFLVYHKVSRPIFHWFHPGMHATISNIRHRPMRFWVLKVILLIVGPFANIS